MKNTDDREVRFVSLLDLQNVAVIIPGQTGVEYHNQVGCVSCLQMGAEGTLEILWDVPVAEFGCDTYDMARLKMQRLLQEHGGIFERVLRVEGMTEAWLDVTFTLSERYLSDHPELGIEPGQEVTGILTYENCD